MTTMHEPTGCMIVGCIDYDLSACKTGTPRVYFSVT